MPESNWSDLVLPFAVGAGSLASGFAMGRNPGVDNPGNLFFQALQIPAITEQRLANAQHQRDMATYYGNLRQHQQNQDVQQRQNRAVEIAKQAAEVGNLAAVESMRADLGPYYEGLAQNAKYIQQLAGSQGFDLPTAGGGGQALPQPPTLGPGQPAMAPPTTPSPVGNAGGITDIPYQQGRTRTFNLGKFSQSTNQPATTPEQSASAWVQKRVMEGYGGIPPSIDLLMTDLARTNEVRQARGLPPIAVSAPDIQAYREWQRRAAPGVWRQEQLQEAATKPDAEVAQRQLSGAGPLAAYEEQRGALREDLSKRQMIEATTPKKPDAGELETLRQQRVVINELQNLSNMAIKNFQGATPTGPIRNKVEGFKQYFGWSPKDVVTFRSGIQNLMNVNLRATSGQNVTAPEEARAKAAFPTLNDPPETLLPKLNYALKYMRMAESAGRGVLQEDGLRLLKHMSTSEGINEALQGPLEVQQVIQYRRDPATGKLVEVKPNAP